jgi:hypothetical protein
MRKLAFLFALFALPLFAHDDETIIFRDGDHSYIQNDHDSDLDRADLGRHYALFTRGGNTYVIHDAATLERVRKIIAPQVELGKQQAKLGGEQAALGAKQAALGAKQAALGAKQAAAGSSERQRELAAGQRELAEQQRELAEQQRPLAEQQRALGEKQREAGRRARQRLDELFDDALRSGVAKRR